VDIENAAAGQSEQGAPGGPGTQRPGHVPGVPEGLPVPVGGREWLLRRGDQEVVVVEVGGGLRRYTAGGVDVLDGYERGELPPGCRGQVLAPWCNRIRDGQYSFGGHDHQLDISEPATGCALHGLVRWLPVVAEEAGADRLVVVATVHARAGYPFTMVLRTTYELTDDGLRVTHEAVNIGDAPAPFSLATHCYLHAGSRVDDQVLQVPADTWIPTDDRLLPLPARPVPGTERDFRDGRRFGSTVLDTAYTDLARDPDGLVRASVTGADGRGVRVWADAAFDWLQVYSSDTQHGERFRRSFAIEPMTAPADAFNSGTSLVVLAPGDRWSGTWGVQPFTADPPAASDAVEHPSRTEFLETPLIPRDDADDTPDPADAGADTGDDRLRRDVPPHHGG